MYLTPEQVVELVPGTSKAYLAQLRFRGQGPAFIKPSAKKVVYRESAVHEWLASLERTTTAA